MRISGIVTVLREACGTHPASRVMEEVMTKLKLPSMEEVKELEYDELRDFMRKLHKLAEEVRLHSATIVQAGLPEELRALDPDRDRSPGPMSIKM